MLRPRPWSAGVAAAHEAPHGDAGPLWGSEARARPQRSPLSAVSTQAPGLLEHAPNSALPETSANSKQAGPLGCGFPKIMCFPPGRRASNSDLPCTFERLTRGEPREGPEHARALRSRRKARAGSASAFPPRSPLRKPHGPGLPPPPAPASRTQTRGPAAGTPPARTPHPERARPELPTRPYWSGAGLNSRKASQGHSSSGLAPRRVESLKSTWGGSRRPGRPRAADTRPGGPLGRSPGVRPGRRGLREGTGIASMPREVGGDVL